MQRRACQPCKRGKVAHTMQVNRDQMKAWPPSPHRDKTPRAWWSTIFSENRFPLFRIML
jgi:hypothetical protein